MRFVLLMAVPLLLGAVTALEPNFIWPMLLADLGIAALAVV
jgi:hypothetical protein